MPAIDAKFSRSDCRRHLHEKRWLPPDPNSDALKQVLAVNVPKDQGSSAVIRHKLPHTIYVFQITCRVMAVVWPDVEVRDKRGDFPCDRDLDKPARRRAAL